MTLFAPTSLALSVAFALVCLVTGPSLAHAHGNDQIIIDAMTEELAKKPDAELFVRRGELFRHLQEWTKADADFVAAARLQPDLVLVDFFRARAFLEAGAPEKALPLADRYVTNAPDEPEGRFLRGDVLAALGKAEDGARDYAEGIRRAPRPRPEHFLRRAKFLAALPSAQPADVLAAIEEGIARLGLMRALVDEAITIELARKNYDAALARIAAMIAHTPRSEAWLVRRADILAQSGRHADAAATYREALGAIEQLPERLRDTVPMEKLIREARAALSRLQEREPD